MLNKRFHDRNTARDIAYIKVRSWYRPIVTNIGGEMGMACDNMHMVILQPVVRIPMTDSCLTASNRGLPNWPRLAE